MKTTLTRAEKLKLLTNWQAQHKAAESLINQIFAVFGSNPESGAYETIWQLFDNHTHVLRVLLGDTPKEPQDPWMTWYCHENNMGAKGAKAGYDGKRKPIKTLDDLLDLIEEGNRR